MSITLGTLTLDDDTDAPKVDISYEYFKTSSEEIIGGHIIATITGVVSYSDSNNSSTTKTGSQVMNRLKAIRNLGKSTGCIDASTIPNFDSYGNIGRITNVSIDQGPDPSWVNQGAYSIEVRGLMKNIPANSFGIVAEDGVQELSRSETLTVGEESHGYVYDTTNGVSKAFVKSSNSITLKVDLLCGRGNPLDILKKVIKTGPSGGPGDTKSNYVKYDQYLASRSLTFNAGGSISFNCDMILTEPGTTKDAFVDLNFSYNRAYQSNSITYITSGSINGLAKINWSDILDLSNTCSASKLTGALNAYDAIYQVYSDLNVWNGVTYESKEQPNCPVSSSSFVGLCRSSQPSTNSTSSDYIRPTSSSMSVSRTDGTINFNFEWATEQNQDGQTCIQDGSTKETTVDITERQQNYVDHTLPGQGTLIQNLNCNSAKKVSITVTTTNKKDSGNCNNNLQCTVNDGLAIAITDYLDSATNWILIGNRTTETLNSYSTKQDYIECRSS